MARHTPTIAGTRHRSALNAEQSPAATLGTRLPGSLLLPEASSNAKTANGRK
jgi:hypothetical protein